jgi:divalent metal cation (Fe/Co/Zn/Cd) transporter
MKKYLVIFGVVMSTIFIMSGTSIIIKGLLLDGKLTQPMENGGVGFIITGIIFYIAIIVYEYLFD